MTNDTNMIVISTLTAIVLFSVVTYVKTDCSGNVDICEWIPWRSWSECSRKCGGGTRKRDRQFCCKLDLVHDIRLCMADCNMDYDYHRQYFRDSEGCNRWCYNGGTYRNSRCYCTNRYKGTCCIDVVTCGRPSSISHGSYSSSDYGYTYSARVTYRCSTGYNMTGSSQRTCTTHGYWSGSTPACTYAVSCNSYPCKNGAACINQLGDYTCNCKRGWTGRNCERDIQPPVVHGCPGDRKIYTENMTLFQSWTEPKFTDPHGKQVHVSKNYHTNSYNFPWGEFTIHFSAVKPTNGLRTECRFTISVKPHPCKAMEPPVNGIIVCNGWRTEYTSVCMFVCKDDYTLGPGSKADHFYICGATGNWLGPTSDTKCYSKEVFPSKNLGTFTTCTLQQDRKEIGEFYIQLLKKSGFNSLCEHYPGDCKPGNVIIKC